MRGNARGHSMTFCEGFRVKKWCNDGYQIVKCHNKKNKKRMSKRKKPNEMTKAELAEELLTYHKQLPPSAYYYTKRKKAVLVEMVEKKRYPNGRPVKKRKDNWLDFPF